MQYYVVKSGMQIYDLSRAYGLGLILEKLCGSPLKVKDLNYCYGIEVTSNYDLKKVKRLAGLLNKEDDKKWDYIFLTLKGRGKLEKIKNCKKLIVNKKLISSILDKFATIKQPEFSESKKEKYETLYQSLDLSATKGFREKIRGRMYHEGSQLYVPIEDFILSIIGHYNFTIWNWNKDGKLILILFNPSVEGVQIGISPDAREITKRIGESLKTYSIGILPTLAYTAVSLAKEISMQKEKPVKFSNLFFGVMVGSGQQRKPYGGGIYPLDFLYRFIDSTEKSGEIFEQWLNVFRSTSNPKMAGYEELALYLSEFITYPSQETFERYLRSHLRIFLSQAKPKLYENEIMQEVLKNV
jgi:hypothetical protein